MHAVVTDSYDGADGLELREVADPKVGPDSVLVRVHAASINPVDYKILEGYLDGAFPTVFPLIPGWDVAGEVVGVGPAVRNLEVGQQVFGYSREDYVGGGTWAELTSLNARAVSPSPSSLDAVQASCLPLAGLTAYQSLVEVLEVGPGQTVLIHGASGGVGTLATQIAAAQGARVIGTASEPNHELIRSFGGEPVSYGDGLQERVRELAPNGVDAVFDLAGGEALASSGELLTTPGRIVSIVDPSVKDELGGIYVFVRPDVTQLDALAQLADAGKLTPVVQSVHDLEQVKAAVEEASSGRVRGKVVLRVP